MPTLLYLAAADVERIALAPAETVTTVREAFLARAAGAAVSAPNLHLALPGCKFSAKAALLPPGPAGAALAAVKWYGNVAGNANRGLAAYHPLLIVSEVATGLPLAVLDGEWVTAARTAAISAAAAQVLARPGARRLGLVGCGRQALAHLETFRALWPLEEVTLFSRGDASARRLAERAAALGLDARVATDPRQAVAGQDVVVSAITKPPASTPGFLRSEWVDRGAFAAMVDMGYAWVRESLSGFDTLITDDFDPETRRSREALNFAGTFDADLAGVLAQPGLAGTPARQRQALLFAGSGLADAAVAVALYRRALQRGVGVMLPA
jgi:ornithine cyclodeaminase/alanine dehydrogenase